MAVGEGICLYFVHILVKLIAGSRFIVITLKSRELRINAMQTTFRRYEKKYLLRDSQCCILHEKLKEHMEQDTYGSYSIRNLYFDTDNYEIIRLSVEKPVFKEKLRVRSYGSPNSNDMIYLELKKKYKKEVFKRRICLTLDEYEGFINKGIRPERSGQILTEIEYFLTIYKPYPRIYIAYERAALVGKKDNNLRITFDKNIRYRSSELSLRNDDKAERILGADQCIMEIKVQGAMPLWLSGILNEMQIFPQPFSKYGYCYKNHLNAALA